MVTRLPGSVQECPAHASFFLPITYFLSVMPMYVSPEMVKKARTADLYSFLLMNHPGQVRKEGLSIRMAGNEGISIRRGYFGYKNFATDDSGNGIDLLMKYLGYSFQEAVVALSAFAPEEALPDTDRKPGAAAPGRNIALPEAAPLPHSRMFAFLISRGVPKEVVASFASRKLIYQSAGTNNIVFVNRERDYCELRGTFTYAKKPFHGCMKSRPDRFWYFKGGASGVDKAYVTEAAIDAISLYLIQKKAGLETGKSVYISIGGASNHQAIHRIKRGIHTILAVDNDEAGQICRDRHPELDYILPVHKDWNDDLRYT